MSLYENELTKEASNAPSGIIFKWLFALGMSDSQITRHIPPMKVAVVYNTNYDLMKAKYNRSEIRYREFNKIKQMTINIMKNDKIMKKTISWYGGTNRDVSVEVFDNYDECAKTYNKQLYNIITRLKSHLERVNNSIEELDKNFINTDYVMEHLSYSK